MHPLRNLGACLLVENFQDGASLPSPMVHARNLPIPATHTLQVPLVSWPVLFLCFALPSFSYSVSPGQPGTEADWLACHLSRGGKRKGRQSSPVASTLLFKVNLPSAFEKGKASLLSPGERLLCHSAFMAWSPILQETLLSSSPLPGTQLLLLLAGPVLPEALGKVSASTCWGLSLVCGILGACVLRFSP